MTQEYLGKMRENINNDIFFRYIRRKAHFIKCMGTINLILHRRNYNDNFIFQKNETNDKKYIKRMRVNSFWER